MTLHVKEAARHVALITIDNQPKRNALSRAAMGDLAEVWERLGASEDCRCIVITGAGDKAFCSGADIGGDLSAPEEDGTADRPRSAQGQGIPEAHCGGGERRLRRRRCRAPLVDGHPACGRACALWPAGGEMVDLSVRRRDGEARAADRLRSRHGPAAHGPPGDGGVRCPHRPGQSRPAGGRHLEASIETASAIAANSPSAVQAVKTQISAGIADYAASREHLEQSSGIACGRAPISPKAWPHSARRGRRDMAEEIDLAGLLRPGDRR